MRSRARFRRCYQYLPARWAIENLKYQRIKGSELNAVNDPEELRAYSLLGLEDDIGTILIPHFIEERCILCFAQSPSDDHMWTRYADEHRGIVLGVDINRKFVHEVNYVVEVKTALFPKGMKDELLKRSKKIPGRAPLYSRAQKYIMPFILTKFSMWNIENEVRAIMERKDLEDGRFFAKLAGGKGIYLEEVVLGRECQNTEEEIQELVKDYPRRVSVRRA